MTKKMLVGFDFDHTIIDDNSDIYVQKLAPEGKIPQEIKNIYSSKCWTDYMAAIFKFLHEKTINKQQIVECMKEINLVRGMKELLQELSKDQYEVVIISDSNTYFIDTIMKHHRLENSIHTVYSNPASFNKSGCLTIDYYHIQDWCDLSTKNLCKGHIFEGHINKRRQEGVEFDRLAFIGDGTNDLCPCLKLKKGDFALARKGFRLVKKAAEYKDKGLVAELVEWETGLDILKCLQQER